MKSDIRRAFALLSKSERRTVSFITAFQVLTGILDLLGLALAGIIAAVSLQHETSGKLTVRLINIFGKFGIHISSWLTLLMYLIGITLCVLTIKSVTNIVLTRSLYSSLAKSLTRIAETFFAKVLRSPYIWIKHLNNQDVGYALTDGLTALAIGLVGSFLTGIVEVSMLALVLIGLIWINPTMAFGAAVFFFLLAATINFVVGGRVRDYGLSFTTHGTESRTTIFDAMFLFREISLADSQTFFESKFTHSRSLAAVAYGRLYWLQQVPKYIMELGIILGAVLLAGMTWLTSHSAQGITSLAVFIMAATRVVPSILRLQGVHLAIKEFSGKSEKTFGLLDEIENIPLSPVIDSGNASNSLNTIPPTIDIRDVTFAYSDASEPIIKGLNLRIDAGSEMTLMGPSGSGKSTICEIILGLLEPAAGSVTYDGDSLSSWRGNSAGSVAYLPQDPHYFAGTIRENITLGRVIDTSSDPQIWHALKLAKIDEFVNELVLGLDTPLSNRGVQLSGGQRQRIGIARTLYRIPQVLVIDEGTSALDPETEDALSRMFSLLQGKTTVLKVAHRISTVSQAHQIAYVESGSLRICGTVDQVRSAIPNFDLSLAANSLG
ncbi:MAG: ABC transporter ATP-binding protein [Candidatus Nanopelagicaceae bacterium]|nr:ABC transporter ATP-binding protein [Candidatus Nanopelagicaceae bacterium]